MWENGVQKIMVSYTQQILVKMLPVLLYFKMVFAVQLLGRVQFEIRHICSPVQYFIIHIPYWPGASIMARRRGKLAALVCLFQSSVQICGFEQNEETLQVQLVDFLLKLSSYQPACGHRLVRNWFQRRPSWSDQKYIMVSLNDCLYGINELAAMISLGKYYSLGLQL